MFGLVHDDDVDDTEGYIEITNAKSVKMVTTWRRGRSQTKAISEDDTTSGSTGEVRTQLPEVDEETTVSKEDPADFRRSEFDPPRIYW